MRLTELSPKWFELPHWASADPFWVGFSFLCPHCLPTTCPTCGHRPHGQRLSVTFVNPIDPSGFIARGVFAWPPNATQGEFAPDRLSRRDGDTFATMKIVPAIGCLYWEDHGSVEIVNGDVRLW